VLLLLIPAVAVSAHYLADAVVADGAAIVLLLHLLTLIKGTWSVFSHLKTTPKRFTVG
jgi:hypothetical protein